MCTFACGFCGNDFAKGLSLSDNTALNLCIVLICCMACRVDSWSQQNSRDPGLTYDGKKNAMLGPHNRLRKRLDRVFFKAAKYNLVSIVMVGMQALPGVTFVTW